MSDLHFTPAPKVTRHTPLSATNDVKVGRASWSDGKVQPRADARATGATTALTPNGGRDTTASAMRNPRENRSKAVTPSRNGKAKCETRTMSATALKRAQVAMRKRQRAHTVWTAV